MTAIVRIAHDTCDSEPEPVDPLPMAPEPTAAAVAMAATERAPKR